MSKVINGLLARKKYLRHYKGNSIWTSDIFMSYFELKRLISYQKEESITSLLFKGFGLEKPSPIQQPGILPLLKGKNIIAQAQSGIGKTAAITIGALELITEEKKNYTRKLTKEIYHVI